MDVSNVKNVNGQLHKYIYLMKKIDNIYSTKYQFENSEGLYN